MSTGVMTNRVERVGGEVVRDANSSPKISLLAVILGIVLLRAGWMLGAVSNALLLQGQDVINATACAAIVICLMSIALTVRFLRLNDNVSLISVLAASLSYVAALAANAS